MSNLQNNQKSEPLNVLYDVSIRQHEEKSLLCLSDLVLAFENAKKHYNWDSQRLSDITFTSFFKNQVYIHLSGFRIVDYEFSIYLNKINSEGMINLLKSLNIYKTLGARETKRVYCVNWLWKIFYIHLFKKDLSVNIPKFIKNIHLLNNNQKISIVRSESKEVHFITKFLQSSNLISSNSITQFEWNGYKYDLKTTLLDMRFIIEYHENQHGTIKNIYKNDILKFENMKNDFIYIVIPFNKEQEQIEYIKECLINRYNIEFANEPEFFRYQSLIHEKNAKIISPKELIGLIKKILTIINGFRI